MDIRTQSDAYQFIGEWERATTPSRCARIFARAATDQCRCASLSRDLGQSARAKQHDSAAYVLQSAAERLSTQL